jgi:hypothetical protein
VPSNPTLTKLSAVVGVTAVIFLLDWFYMAYVTSHGLLSKSQEFTVGTLNVPISLPWLPVAGVALVSLVTWYEVSSKIFPRRAGPDLDSLSSIRLIRVAAISLAVFVTILYVPYIIGSAWFWARMSNASGISQIRDFAQSLLNTDESMMSLDPLWQYSISQFVALIGMLFSAWIFGRVGKRPRKQRQNKV